jgi:inorganic pyrophosphatase
MEQTQNYLPLKTNNIITNSDNYVKVYVEIEQFSNIKYEYNKVTQRLEVDRFLNKPFVYPYAYGFIPNTCADDGDELDILIISNKPIQNDANYNVYIIGALDMSDEKGKDEKIFCVFEEDYKAIKDIEYLSDRTINSIISFFSEYKSDVPGKWSKVRCLMNKTEAVRLYKKSICK